MVSSSHGFSVRVAGGELVNDYNCVFSFDAKFLFCPSGNVIKVLNVQSGRFCGQLEGHKDRVTSIIINERNHLQLVSASLDGYIVVWDIGTDYSAIKALNINKPIHKIGQLKCMNDSFVVILSDGKQYVLTDTNSLLSNSNLSLCRFSSFTSKSVSLSYETSVLAAIDSPKKLLVWSGEQTRCVMIPAPTIFMSFTGIATHPTDRNVIAAANNSGRIYLWVKLFSATGEAATVPAFHLHWHSDPLRSISFSPEGTFLFSAGEECVFVKWLWRKQQRTFLPRLGAPVSSIALSPDGAAYAVGLVDNSIAVISSNLIILKSIRGFINGGNIPATRPKSSTGDSLMAPAGLLFDRHLNAIVANSRPGHLQFFDAENNNNLMLLDVTSENYVSGGSKLLPVTEVIKADISIDGRWLATVQCRGDNDNEYSLKIWQYDFEKSRSFVLNTVSSRAHASIVTTLKFSPHVSEKSSELSNMCLISTSTEGLFRLWRCQNQATVESNDANQMASGRWFNTFSSNHHSLPIIDTDWSADGSVFALAAGHFILLVDGNADGFNSKADDCMEEDGVQNEWLISTLTIDSQSRITSLKFGRNTESSFLVGCSTENEGFVCVWNLATLQMIWKTETIWPCLISNPESEYLTVFCGASTIQKTLMSFKPSAPEESQFTFNFTLPAICSDNLSSQIASITSAVFVPKNECSSGDKEFSKADLYFMTADQKLYAISSSVEANQNTGDSANRFKFSSPSVVSGGSLPRSALSSFLSLGQVKSHMLATSNQSTKSTIALAQSKYDSLFETAPHLLPPVSRICAEFLLKRCAERCGLASVVHSFSNEADNSAFAADDSSYASNGGDTTGDADSFSLIEKTTAKHLNISWIQETV